jgi:hypothetical protein
MRIELKDVFYKDGERYLIVGINTDQRFDYKTGDIFSKKIISVLHERTKHVRSVDMFTFAEEFVLKPTPDESNSLTIIDVDMIMTDILFSENNEEIKSGDKNVYTKEFLSSTEINIIRKNAYLDNENMRLFLSNNSYGSSRPVAKNWKIVKEEILKTREQKSDILVVTKVVPTDDLENKFDFIKKACSDFDSFQTLFVEKDSRKSDDIFNWLKDINKLHIPITTIVEDNPDNVAEIILDERLKKAKVVKVYVPNNLIWLEYFMERITSLKSTQKIELITY